MQSVKLSKLKGQGTRQFNLKYDRITQYQQ